MLHQIKNSDEANLWKLSSVSLPVTEVENPKMVFDNTTLVMKKRRMGYIPERYTVSQKSRYDVGLRSPLFDKQVAKS
jgi:hypothetical protein